MLISSVLGVLVLFFTFSMTALPNTSFQNLLFDYFSMFGYIVGILLIFVSVLLLLDRLFILFRYWFLYKFGYCYVANVHRIYHHSGLSNGYYLVCKYRDNDTLYLLESELDKTGYLKKTPPDTVNIYISKWDVHNYFIDIPIKV